MRIDRLRYQKKRRGDALSRASLDDMDGGERRLGTASGDDVAWLALACTAQGAASISKIGACARTLNCPASPARIDLEIPTAERVSRGKLHMAAAPPLSPSAATVPGYSARGLAALVVRKDAHSNRDPDGQPFQLSAALMHATSLQGYVGQCARPSLSSVLVSACHLATTPQPISTTLHLGSKLSRVPQ